MNAPLAEDRLQRILDLLSRNGRMRTTALTEALGVSGATTRRDLDLLASRGLIRKLHGGAALASQDQQYTDRQQLHQDAKTRLAQTALNLIQPGQTLYLDAGTTAQAVAHALKRTPHLTRTLRVVTHGIDVAYELNGECPLYVVGGELYGSTYSLTGPDALDTTAQAVAHALKRAPQLTRTLRVVTHGIDVAYELNGECPLYVVGGELYGSTYSLTGPDALDTIRRYRYDLFLVGCTSIDPTRGLTNSNLIEAQQKAAIMTQATRTVLIADHSKWGPTGFATFATLNQIHAWVTDHAGPVARCAFEEAGVTVHDSA